MKCVTFLLTALCACAGHGDSYVVFISPSFNDEHISAILEAEDEWSTVTPVRFANRIQTCDFGEPIDDTMCVEPVDREYFQTHGPSKTAIGLTGCNHFASDACRIYIDNNDENFGGREFRQIVAHEMGHAMGLTHWGGDSGIPTTEPVVMAPNADEAAPTPVCNDAMQWYAVRGRTVPSCGNEAMGDE